MRKPNLVVFLPDQQRADTLACYGGTKVHAPALNKLAATSVVFERAYVTQPICTPSRASLFTGLWPHTTGCTRNGITLSENTPTFLELLQDDDYHTAYMGKWQLGNNATAQRGFREWISTESVSDYSQFLVKHGIVPDQPVGAVSRLVISTLPLELSKPLFLQKHACRFIEEHWREPFILFVAYLEPHTPYNSRFNEEHSLEEIELDETALIPPEEDVPLRYRLIRERQQRQVPSDRARLPQLYYVGLTPDDYRGLRQRYFGLVTMIDQSIGSILTCLERHDILDQTIIVHTSDHGDMMGAHQLFGKEVMFEEAARVPYLVKLAGQQRSSRISQAVSHIDFLPTLLALLGRREHPGPGKSRLPLLGGETTPPENVFLEWSPNREKMVKGSSLGNWWNRRRAIKESTRTIVMPDGFKLSLRDKDLNELYNLKADPIEATNLYYTGNYKEIITRGRAEIRRWQESVGDELKI